MKLEYYHEYITLEFQPSQSAEMAKVLTERSKEGWELASVYVSPVSETNTTSVFAVIRRAKEDRAV